MDDLTSALKMETLVFDKILFNRSGLLKSKNKLAYKLKANCAKNQEQDIYMVNLILEGFKEDEYNIEISLTGYFTFNSSEKLDDETKNDLINTNAVAIMMPYLRSQASLLTAQPGVDCIVLPPFNINNFINDEHKKVN